MQSVEIGVDFDIMRNNKPVFKVLFTPATQDQLIATMNKVRDLVEVIPIERVRDEVLKVPGVKDVVSVQ